MTEEKHVSVGRSARRIVRALVAVALVAFAGAVAGQPRPDGALMPPHFDGPIADNSLGEWLHGFVQSGPAAFRDKLVAEVGGRPQDRDPFRDLGIPWAKMRAGFTDLVGRSRESQWNLQHFAYFACRARDGTTFRRLLPQIDAKDQTVTPWVWRGAYTLDFCTSLFTRRS